MSAKRSGAESLGTPAASSRKRRTDVTSYLPLGCWTACCHFLHGSFFSLRSTARLEMWSLAKSIYLYATSKEGLDNAGKTTLLSAIKSLYNTSSDVPAIAQKTVPTIGQNVSTIDLPDMYLKIWDVGGQLSMRNLWKSYYGSAHAVIFVVDSTDLGDGSDWEDLGSSVATSGLQKARRTDRDESAGGVIKASDLGRLEECRLVLESVISEQDMVGVPILVLANKQDREDCVETVKIKEGLVRKVFEGEKGGAVRDSRVLPISALHGEGVREAVEWVRTRVKWNQEGRPPVMR
ncbi:MAG: hypothetical protein LQ341_003015 [Variospora aurantia]|nr:MAG: hypothetical protein LQ341_003015 [Variospora aurantia]